MTFNEPVIEFVPLDPELSFRTDTSCTDSVTCQEYGVETCLGTAPMNSCDENSDFL